MAETALRLVGKDNMDKQKALDAALVVNDGSKALNWNRQHELFSRCTTR